MTEYRRTFTSGPSVDRWEVLPAGIAEAVPTHGPLSIGDVRADAGQFLEVRYDGGPWRVFSYWRGAADFATVARLGVIERLETDLRHLNEKATRILDVSATEIEAARSAITSAEQRLKDALATERQGRETVKDLRDKAAMASDQISILRAELERVPAQTVESVTA
jgi:hypothetical protein